MLSSRLLKNPPSEARSDAEVVGRWLSAAERQEVLQRLNTAAEREAASLLARAQAEAADVLARAAAAGEAGRAEAFAEGHAAGMQAGLNAAEVIADRLQAAAEHAAGLAAEALLAAESELVDLALAIAAHVIGESLAREHAAIAISAAREALAAAAAAPVRLRLAPADLEPVRAAIEHDDGVPQLVPDGSISVGGCVLQLEDGTVDLRVESRQDSVRSMLLSGR